MALAVSAVSVVGMPAQNPGTSAADQRRARILFTLSCKACHSLNGVMVGPSLLEIAFLYKGNPQGIVDWAIKPGRRRDQMVPM